MPGIRCRCLAGSPTGVSAGFGGRLMLTVGDVLAARCMIRHVLRLLSALAQRMRGATGRGMVAGLASAAVVLTAAMPVQAGSVHAPDKTGEVCMSQAEMRSLAMDRTVIPSVAAIRTARATAGGGKVVRAALCQREGEFRYHVSVLRKDGRVARVVVDGRSGKVVSLR